MSESKHNFRSSIRRAVDSYWVERVVFILGVIILFLSEQFLTPRVDAAKEDVAYYERNAIQIEHFETARQHWLAEYNRAVASKPQDRTLVAVDAFQLFVATDQILSGLRAVAEHDGRGEVSIVVADKNQRRKDAEQELRKGDAEALVKRVNSVHEDHEGNVELLATKLMQKRQTAISEEANLSHGLKSARLLGTFFLAFAFLLREWHEYKKREAEKKKQQIVD